MVCELPVLDPPAACLQFEMKKRERERKTNENMWKQEINDAWIAIESCVFKKKKWESTLMTSYEKWLAKSSKPRKPEQRRDMRDISPPPNFWMENEKRSWTTETRNAVIDKRPFLFPHDWKLTRIVYNSSLRPSTGNPMGVWCHKTISKSYGFYKTQ